MNNKCISLNNILKDFYLYKILKFVNLINMDYY